MLSTIPYFLLCIENKISHQFYQCPLFCMRFWQKSVSCYSIHPRRIWYVICSFARVSLSFMLVRHFWRVEHCFRFKVNPFRVCKIFCDVWKFRVRLKSCAALLLLLVCFQLYCCMGCRTHRLRKRVTIPKKRRKVAAFRHFNRWTRLAWCFDAPNRKLNYNF